MAKRHNIEFVSTSLEEQSIEAEEEAERVPEAVTPRRAMITRAALDKLG